MPVRRGPLLGRFRFTIGEAFDPSDPLAVFVMQLSIALGDLRTVADYVTRRNQPQGHRAYFVRVMTAHLSEVVINLIDTNPPVNQLGKRELARRRSKKPQPDHVPGLEQLIQTFDRSRRQPIRDAHARIIRLLRQPMIGRDPIDPGTPEERPRTLRDELRRVRNDFAHYGHDEWGRERVVRAIEASANDVGTYDIREGVTRAVYADITVNRLLHPFDTDDLAYDLHGQIVGLIGPLGEFISRVESAWMASRPDGVVELRRYR